MKQAILYMEITGNGVRGAGRRPQQNFEAANYMRAFGLQRAKRRISDLGFGISGGRACTIHEAGFFGLGLNFLVQLSLET